MANRLRRAPQACLAVSLLLATAVAHHTDAGYSDEAVAVEAIADGDSQQLSAVDADLISQLDAADFSVRLSATKRLKRLTVDEIATVAELANSHASAEVSSRLLKALELHYVSDDPDAVQAASMALEELRRSDRLLVAEAAQGSLDRNWRIRVELAANELQRLGAAVQRSNPDQRSQLGRAGFGRAFPQFAGDDLKVFLTDQYQGGSEGLKHFERMSSLIGPTGMRIGLGVYVIDGHPLSEEDVSELQNQLGVGRVVTRGRVALGITGIASPFPGFAGCLLREVTPNSSAAVAGLHGGDLITGLGDEPLRDFDDLVQRLKVFDVGDTVQFTVIRNFGENMDRRFFRPPRQQDIEPLQPQRVSVTLKGWADFANQPEAPPTTESPSPE